MHGVNIMDFIEKKPRTITQDKIIKTDHNKRVKSKVNLILILNFITYAEHQDAKNHKNKRTWMVSNIRNTREQYSKQHKNVLWSCHASVICAIQARKAIRRHSPTIYREREQFLIMTFRNALRITMKRIIGQIKWFCY